MNKDLMFSSKTDQWATPQAFFDELNREFSFTLDPCADAKPQMHTLFHKR